MKYQMGKTLLRKGLQTLLVALIMIFFTNLVSPLKAATFEAELEQQALSHSGWAMAATVGGTVFEVPEHYHPKPARASLLDQISSTIVLLLLMLFSCCGIFCIVWSLKLS